MKCQFHFNLLNIIFYLRESTSIILNYNSNNILSKYEKKNTLQKGLNKSDLFVSHVFFSARLQLVLLLFFFAFSL